MCGLSRCRCAPGDQLRVEWLDPSGAVSTTADYGELPNAGELCFTAQLPIAGFAPASQPGNWTVRAVSNGSVAFSRTFTIAADTDNGGPVVTSVTWSGKGSGEQAQEIDFTVRGKNFQPNSLVLIAQYKPAGGWTYLASLQARDATANQLTVHYAGLPANEYLVIVENPDQRMSRPDAVPDRDRRLQAADGGGRAVDHHAGAVRHVLALGQ